MIKQDQHIIYISQAKVAVTIKQSESMKTGMQQKKIVITTRRCLFFQSLSNQVLEIEYQIMTKKKKANQDKQKQKQKKQKKRISINQFPQHSFPINDRQCKVMIDEQQTCHKYLQKIGLLNFIKSIMGIVLLKNIPKMRFQLLAFPTLKDGFRFCKALVCSQAWTKYEKHCAQNNVQVNKMWARLLSDIANNQKSITLIDPDFFLTGSKQQINSFIVLINQIPFAHSFQHRYSITNNQIAQYSTNFLQYFQQKTHSLIFRHNNLTFMYLDLIFNPRLKFQHLLHLDLSYNKLTDQVFTTLLRFTKQSKKLSNYILSHNTITLNNSTLLINFLKSTQVMLTLDLSYNQINDNCVGVIQKYIIMSSNPPIDQLNLSYNKFTKKAAWRLFVGNNRYYKYHTYLNFVIYPIPIKPDTFPQQSIQYPKTTQLMNFNIHSALVQQFQQQSFMKHTLNQLLTPQNTIIKFIRRLPKNMKLPHTRQQIHKCTQIANRIQNFIYSPQFVQNMYDMAQQINKFQFNIPPVTKARYIKYLSDKLNQALFIRDHYSVRYILKAFRIMGVDFQGYQPRVNKLLQRNDIVGKKLCHIVNLDCDQIDINHELDQIVREGLRLYLNGTGIQSIYYLKYLRDKWIERLIAQKNNPQHFIYKKMADKNMNFDEQVTQKQFIIPYQIRVQKKINQNFYLHPWKANYLVLSQILKIQFQQCLQFLQQSSKKQKFAIYFQRIQQRIQFMRNQFALFNYNKFKSTYHDLKINCSRLLSMYRYITQKNYYLQIPSIARKVPITKQKIITVHNQTRFKDDYHISRYPNINTKAKSSGFYNYPNKITKYGSQLFFQQYLRLKALMDAMLKTIQIQNKQSKIAQQIVTKVSEIIKYIRQAIYPQQLKQQFYLRILNWRNGKYSNNRQILMYMSFFTMYLRPPLALQKYIIAAILSCQNIMIGQMPMCIVSDVNKATDINIQQLQKTYVERDWMGGQKLLIPLLKQNGKFHIQIQLLTKKKVQQNPRESMTVGQIVSNLTSQIKDIEDVSHFWLYMGIVGQTGNLVVLEQSQHIGQILCEKQDKQKYFLFKRRIYCPEWKYVYKKYSQTVINNLFYDWKYEYLMGQFFVNNNQLINLAASMIILDTAQQVTGKNDFNDLMSAKLKSLGSIYKGYLPAQSMNKLFKNSSQLMTMLKDKINQKVMKKQHLKTIQIKKQILQKFQEYPQFFSSNYLFVDRNKKTMKMSINFLQIYINSAEQIQCFGLQKIISIVPKAKYLLINYHKHQNATGKVNLFGDQNKILSTAQDILAYCMIRIKMVSPALYAAFRYQYLMTTHMKIKNPTKDIQILDTIRRLKKKLQSASPTIIQSDLIPYFSQSKYIKVYTTRKLYANASNDKLDLVEEANEQYPNENDYKFKKNKFDNSFDISGHNAFKTLFPQISKFKMMEDEQPNDFQMGMGINRSYSEPPQLSAYNNISLSYQQPDSNMNNSVIKPQNSIIQERDLDLDDPPQLTPIRPTQKPIQEDQYQPITTAQKTRNRLPPKKNR